MMVEDVWRRFRRSVESTPVTALRRIFFEIQGAIDGRDGPLELTFADGCVFVIECGGDGEHLALRDGPWVDPFVEPLEDENERWVSDHGKWTAVPVGSDDALGGVFIDNSPEITLVGNARGIWKVEFRTESGLVSVSAVGDETLVEVARNR